MPSIASHFVVAKQVSNILNIKTDDYFLGNILPDIIDDKNSHMKIKGSYYLIPDVNLFIETNKYNRDIFIGYLTHLLLDKYFLEEFIPKNIENFQKLDLFLTKKIYNDYTYINYKLVKKYNLDVDYIVNIINDSKFKLDENKKEVNINSIKRKLVENSMYIDFDKYTNFLDTISIIIADEIKQVVGL